MLHPRQLLHVRPWALSGGRRLGLAPCWLPNPPRSSVEQNSERGRAGLIRIFSGCGCLRLVTAMLCGRGWRASVLRLQAQRRSVGDDAKRSSPHGRDKVKVKRGRRLSQACCKARQAWPPAASPRCPAAGAGRQRVQAGREGLASEPCYRSHGAQRVAGGERKVPGTGNLGEGRSLQRGRGAEAPHKAMVLRGANRCHDQSACNGKSLPHP